MRIRTLLGAIAVPLVLSACGDSGDPGQPDIGFAASDGESAEALRTALGMLGAEGGGAPDDAGSPGSSVGADSASAARAAHAALPHPLEFRHLSRIAELADEDPGWASAGIPVRFSYLPTPDSLLGIDPRAADTVLTAGPFSLVNGGQDTAAIAAAAVREGWEGAAPHFTSDVGQLLLRGADSTASAIPGEDMSRVDADGETLADHSTAIQLTACLGDVVAARLEPRYDPSGARVPAVGVQVGETGPESVICVLTDDPETVGETVAEAASAGSSHFTGAQASVAGDAVRIVLEHADGEDYGVILDLLTHRELPGLDDHAGAGS